MERRGAWDTQVSFGRQIEVSETVIGRERAADGRIKMAVVFPPLARRRSSLDRRLPR
jgi:hypothetical protein